MTPTSQRKLQIWLHFWTLIPHGLMGWTTQMKSLAWKHNCWRHWQTSKQWLRHCVGLWRTPNSRNQGGRRCHFKVKVIIPSPKSHPIPPNSVQFAWAGRWWSGLRWSGGGVMVSWSSIFTCVDGSRYTCRSWCFLEPGDSWIFYATCWLTVWSLQDAEQMVKSVAKARQRFQEQLQRTEGGNASRGHGGLAGRPNLNSLAATDPEILRSWKPWP